MFILYGAKANQAKGLKLLAKLKYDIKTIWKNCVGTNKMAHFTATIWQIISSDIITNKIDTNNFIFSANITQNNLAQFFRYVKT